MTSRLRGDIGELLRNERVIGDALRRAAREALLRDKQLGLSVPVWRNGHTEWVPPDQIDTLLRGTEDAPRPSRTK